MLAELPKKNCLNCANFAWWDGDYCCVAKFKLFQEAKDRKFNEDILAAIESNKNCKKWKKANVEITEIYMELFNEFMKIKN